MAEIRAYRPSDRQDVTEVCLRTGDSGADATGLYDSDELLADIYVRPYVDLEPELALVVDVGDRVAGYIVATVDTRAFVERYRSRWLPTFAATYTRVVPPVTASDRIVEIGFTPERMLNDDLVDYPAHLHIDLLAELQGQGFGRKLVRRLLTELATRGVPGVHLGVSERNTSARAFYKKLGFVPLPSDDGTGSLLGIRTDVEV